MGSLGVVAVVLLVLVLLVAAVLNLMTRRRRRSAPGQPRTVADLVRMRGGAEVTDSDRPDDDDAVEAAPSADDLERVPVAVPRQATGPGPDRTLKAATAERGHAPAAGGVASLLPGESGDEGGLAVDTPWVRAARMTESDGVTVPAARSAPDETGTLAVTGRSTGDTGHGARVPLDEPTAAPRPMVGGAHLPPAPAESAVAESAVVDPAVAESAVAERRVAGPGVAEPAVADPAVAEPAVAEPAVAEPAVAEPAVAEPAVAEPAAVGTPAVERAAAETAAVEPAAPDQAPLPARSPAPADPTPARTAGRPRRPADTAAEQAAADLALLRTFGVGRPGHAPEPDDEATELAVRATGRAGPVAGVAQPVLVHVVGRTGGGIDGAVVTLHDHLGHETASVPTGADGRAMLTAPHPGGYVIVAASGGHQPGAAAVTVTDVPVEAEIVLTRSAILAGIVIGEDGPRAGARVVLVQDGDTLETVTTGAGGGYHFGDLTAGEYGLSVSVPDGEPAVVLVHLSDGQQVRHDVELVPSGLTVRTGP